MKNLNRRIEELEKQKKQENKPAWVIVYSDDQVIPEGVKAYAPEADPDLWDED